MVIKEKICYKLMQYFLVNLSRSAFIYLYLINADKSTFEIFVPKVLQ